MEKREEERRGAERIGRLGCRFDSNATRMHTSNGMRREARGGDCDLLCDRVEGEARRSEPI